jgi:hypothetical protein
MCELKNLHSLCTLQMKLLPTAKVSDITVVKCDNFTNTAH